MELDHILNAENMWQYVCGCEGGAERGDIQHGFY